MTLQFSFLVLHLQYAHRISVVHKDEQNVTGSFYAYDFDNEKWFEYVMFYVGENFLYLVNEQANKLLSSPTAQLYFEGM